MAVITKYWDNGDALTLVTSRVSISVSSDINNTGQAREKSIIIRNASGEYRDVLIKQGYKETKYAVQHVRGSFTNPNNALGSPNNTWAGLVNSSTSQQSIYKMDVPTAPITRGESSITVICKKGSNTGSPTLTVNLYEGNKIVGVLLDNVPVQHSASQGIVADFDLRSITDYNNIYIEVISNAVSGARDYSNSVQIDAIVWDREVNE